MDDAGAPRSVYSNDILEVAGTLGIEAARNAQLNELREVIQFDGSYVNVRHLSLLADIMTKNGFLMSVTRHGFSRSGVGVLARASFEQSFDVL